MKNVRCRLTACILVFMLLLGGCGKSTSFPVSDWALVEYTVKGATTRAEDLVPEVKELAPAFRCEDGEHVTVSNNGKDHPGTITEEDGQYVIRFEDTEETMSAQLKDDTLTMSNSKGTVTFVFRKD